MNKLNRGHPTRSQAHVTGSRPKNRVPLTGRRTRMELKSDELDPNFKYKWINDTPALMDKYVAAGYLHVKTNEGVTIGQRTVDTGSDLAANISLDVGQGVIAFLMKQPMEYANEDRELRQDARKDLSNTLERDLNSGKDGTYGSVKIS